MSRKQSDPDTALQLGDLRATLAQALTRLEQIEMKLDKLVEQPAVAPRPRRPVKLFDDEDDDIPF
jgi:hypothetical protein